MITFSGYNVPEVFSETLIRMRHYLVREDSRNGAVRSFQVPIALTIQNPLQRVLTDPTRDANPFFHVAEFCWMMAGSNNARWIALFNKRMLEYSDDGYALYAAYGHRWRKAFGLDQVKKAIAMLKKNPNDRRIVISMWDADLDLGHVGKDIPCNTHIYLRVVEGRLHMTVCNRSNDIIWGMLGANAVHMTMLHELIAQAAGLQVGYYTLFSNNAHIYESVPNFDYYMNGVPAESDIYFRSENRATVHVPLLQGAETYVDFVTDCQNLVNLPNPPTQPIITNWMKNVGAPIVGAWFSRKVGVEFNTKEILADDWRIACEEWLARRNPPVGNLGGDNNAGLVSGQQASTRVDSGVVQSGVVAGVDPERTDLGLAPVEPNFDGALRP